MSCSREEEILNDLSGEEMQVWAWLNPECYEMMSIGRLIDREEPEDE